MIFVYLILLAISVFFYIMYTGNFSYYLMVFMTVLPILLFILDFYISRKLKVCFTQIAQKANEKTPVRLEVVASNPTIFPIANLEIVLEYHSAVDKGKSIAKINTPVMPKESHSMMLNVASLHLGSVEFRIKKCRIFDFLRLFKFKLRGKNYKQGLKESTIFVFPQYSRLDNNISDYSYFGIDSDEFFPDKKGDDPSQIFDIHEYIEGDKPNRIHWKLSAKQDTVMVKDYSMPMSFALDIFINLNTDSSKKYDAIIESALSVSMLLTERGISHCISWFDKQTNTLQSFNIKDEQDHIDCAENLIKTKTYSSVESPIYPFTAENEQINFAHLIVVSQQLQDNDIDQITSSGFASRYLFIFAVKDLQPQQPEISENVCIVRVQKDHIAQALSDIEF